MLTDADRDAVAALQARWIEAEISEDRGALRALMSDDIAIWPDDAAPVRGIDAVLAATQGPFPIRSVEISDVGMQGGPVHAWKTARFTTQFDNDGETVTIHGRHLWLLRRESGAWKLAGLSWEIER